MYYIRILKGHRYLLNKTYYKNDTIRVNDEIELTREEMIDFIKSKKSIAEKFDELKYKKEIPF